jgi:hypothetical protein
VALVDEGWAIHPDVVEDGLEPTMAEREQPQLWLFSTAHHRATELMPDVRNNGIDDWQGGDTLLLEWSADPACSDMDEAEWRAASPHWDDRRKGFVKRQAGKEGFREQWLNIWPEIVGDPPWIGKKSWDALAGEPVITTDSAAQRTVVIYPDAAMTHWYLVEAGMNGEEVHLRALGPFTQKREALTKLEELAKQGPMTIIHPRVMRGRIGRIGGVREIISAGESDVAAATTNVRNIVESGLLVHDGSQLLAEHVHRAVADRFGDTFRISTSHSPGPVEFAKAMALAAWWCTRSDRPRSVVV